MFLAPLTSFVPSLNESDICSQAISIKFCQAAVGAVRISLISGEEKY